MKLPFAVVAMLLASLLVLASVDKAQAQWNDIDYGYAVTTEWGHSVTAWAGTTDSNVETVEFEWLDPNGNPVWNQRSAVIGEYVTPHTPPDAPQEIISWAQQHQGIKVKYACNRQVPNVIGNWLVHTIFHALQRICGRCSHHFHCFPHNVVPEVPFGTISIALSMLGVLGVFAVKKKRSLVVKVPN
jgi:hypothetical protein